MPCEALGCVDAILAVEGLDGVFVGPSHRRDPLSPSRGNCAASVRRPS